MAVQVDRVWELRVMGVEHESILRLAVADHEVHGDI